MVVAASEPCQRDDCVVEVEHAENGLVRIGARIEVVQQREAEVVERAAAFNFDVPREVPRRLIPRIAWGAVVRTSTGDERAGPVVGERRVREPLVRGQAERDGARAGGDGGDRGRIGRDPRAAERGDGEVVERIERRRDRSRGGMGGGHHGHCGEQQSESHGISRIGCWSNEDGPRDPARARPGTSRNTQARFGPASAQRMQLPAAPRDSCGEDTPRPVPRGAGVRNSDSPNGT